MHLLTKSSINLHLIFVKSSFGNPIFLSLDRGASSIFRCAVKNSRWHHSISIGEGDTARGPEQSISEAEEFYFELEWRLDADGF